MRVSSFPSYLVAPATLSGFYQVQKQQPNEVVIEVKNLGLQDL